MNSLARKKFATALAVVALVFVATVLPASATGSQRGDHGDHRDHDRAVHMVPVDLFYGFDVGYVLFAGGTPEDVCTETAPPTAPARVSERRDGTLKVTARSIPNVDLYLYEFDGPAPALIELTCAAIFDGDPSTQPLQPFAVGTGRAKITLTGLEDLDDTDGIHIANSVKGTATAEDGSRWHVRGQASFDTDEAGFPIGDPNGFQSLRVKQLRRGH